MRNRTILAYVLTLAITGCGDDGDQATPDAAPEPPPPRIIEGGGIGDGPIEGVANVYVLDDSTRDPLSGATVRVGEVEGTTDSTGLFVARGVTGPQTVIVKATDHRPEMWIGANGANITFSLQPGANPNPRSATMTGALSLASLPALDTNHAYFVQVGYSASDDLGDDANEIPTPNDTNQCLAVSNQTPCDFTVVTRTGEVALFASIIDVDTKGTFDNPADDTYMQAGWGYRPAATIAANATMTGMNLTPLAGTDLNDVTVDIGTPPASLPERGALVQVELPNRAVISLGFVATTSPTIRAPKVSAVSGATAYRLIAVASTGGETPTESIVLRRNLSGTTLSAGTWLAPPGSTDLSRTGASWAPVSGAAVHAVEYTQGTANLLNVTVFDNTSLFTIPNLVALPGGRVTAKVQAIGATGFDVTNFSLDADRDKLDRVSGETIDLP
ncbi:MAG: hypothetical protein ACKV2T_15820 [Kofleriaceae bacterium]